MEKRHQPSSQTGGKKKNHTEKLEVGLRTTISLYFIFQYTLKTRTMLIVFLCCRMNIKAMAAEIYQSSILQLLDWFNQIVFNQPRYVQHITTASWSNITLACKIEACNMWNMLANMFFAPQSYAISMLHTNIITICCAALLPLVYTVNSFTLNSLFIWNCCWFVRLAETCYHSINLTFSLI